jgi:hypothetical protein
MVHPAIDTCRYTITDLHEYCRHQHGATMERPVLMESAVIPLVAELPISYTVTLVFDDQWTDFGTDFVVRNETGVTVGDVIRSVAEEMSKVKVSLRASGL